MSGVQNNHLIISSTLLDFLMSTETWFLNDNLVLKATRRSSIGATKNCYIASIRFKAFQQIECNIKITRSCPCDGYNHIFAKMNLQEPFGRQILQAVNIILQNSGVFV